MPNMQLNYAICFALASLQARCARTAGVTESEGAIHEARLTQQFGDQTSYQRYSQPSGVVLCGATLQMLAC